MARDLRRFERLEKARSAEPERPAATVSERFQEPRARATAADPPRAGPQPLEATTGLAVESLESAETQPFVRCVHCEADSGKFATVCQNCGQPLDTPAQRAFNARLWSERRAQDQVDEQELAREHEAERAREELQAAQLKANQAALGASLAQMARHSEEMRLESAGLMDDRASLGIRALELIPDARVRFGVLATAVALGGYGLYHWIHNPLERFSPWHLVVVGLGLLFIPFRAVPWRRDRWW